jgi:hypothetical protein
LKTALSAPAIRLFSKQPQFGMVNGQVASLPQRGQAGKDSANRDGDC